MEPLPPMEPLAPLEPLPPDRTRRPAWGLTEARFTTLAAVIITVVSMLIAAGAWRTTEAASRASDLDSLVIQQQARRQQELEAISGRIDLDLRLLSRYQAYVLAAARLDTAAAAAGEPGTQDRQLLEVEAQGQRSLARAMNQFFLGAFPEVDASGIASYDPERVRRTLEADSYRLADLRPEATALLASQAHRQTAAFVLIVILFAFSLLLLTVAQVIRGRARLPLAVTGTIVAAGGLVVMVLVETVLYRVA